MASGRRLTGWRARWREIIFEADTPSGKIFDVLLLLFIVASVLAVALESVASIRERYGTTLRIAEWTFTAFFTIEYLLRLVCVKRPTTYAFSFFGIVDFLATIPAYLSLLVPGAQSLLIIRALRLLRVFRVLKLGRFVSEANELFHALRSSFRKIAVFLGVVLVVVMISGALMYLIEGGDAGFTSIPRSMYWAIVTMTTVGYGDIAPTTVLGQAVAALLMIVGYGVIAVPTGIISVGISRRGPDAQDDVSTRVCNECSREGHDPDAVHCKFCGDSL